MASEAEGDGAPSQPAAEEAAEAEAPPQPAAEKASDAAAEAGAEDGAAAVAEAASATTAEAAPPGPAPTGDALPEPRGGGGRKALLDRRHERLTGVVARPASGGLGVITSPAFEGEVLFASPSGVMPEFQEHPLKEGEAVEFDVQEARDHGPTGKPRAAFVKPLLGRKPEECLGQRHRGYIRRFADRWGFLNSAAFDGDLFVHRDNLLLSPEQVSEVALRGGQAVDFDVAKDDRGRVVAKQITTQAQSRASDCVGKRLRGYIRSFQGAWGFVNSDQFAGDLFLHRDSLTANSQQAELGVGTAVEFTIERDHHRKKERNRLVAREVDVLPTQVASVLPQGLAPTAYYYGQDPVQDAAAAAAAAAGYAQPGYGAPAPYGAQFPGMPYGPQFPGMPLQYPPQPYYGQQHYVAAAPQPMAFAEAAPMPGATAPVAVAGVAAPAPGAAQQAQQALAQPAQQAGAAAQPLPSAAAQPQPGTAGPAAAAGEGQLHLTTHDWEPDQPGQLWVTRGTLVTVSFRAEHGWVYAGTVQLGSSKPASEGWVPQAVVKRVSLCRVIVDWPAEGANTLGVTRGEIIAVSKEADRGWVYGERLGPKQLDGPSEGWLPKKALECMQT